MPVFIQHIKQKEMELVQYRNVENNQRMEMMGTSVPS